MSECNRGQTNDTCHVQMSAVLCVIVAVWNPYLAKDVKLIEGVQRRATKMVQGIQHWKYDDRLNYLGLMHLEKRRVRSDLFETFKVMKGMYDITEESFFIMDDSGRRGHNQKLFKKRLKANA